jgi:hypothetical protein
MMTQPTIPLHEQITCVETMIPSCQRVVARHVADGKLTKQQADHRIAVLKAVLETVQTVGRNA